MLPKASSLGGCNVVKQSIWLLRLLPHGEHLNVGSTGQPGAREEKMVNTPLSLFLSDEWQVVFD